ncbi:AraC family transcriptional regulator [Polyangium sp. 6x1]|uniref:AraC family transcriptional regulator n=1 Tax=Polyangium sp. 6x1 TaxID=3042689 RepID=UPI002482B989|nr:AraC family transcriptional regulator [Polyangium sp. 6x1]MDI1442829.1 AraC family transcriptional regulator ligand-binding domain-containing protein [Polyangium sp. 6x1]
MTSNARNADFARQPTHNARLAGRIVDVAAASGTDTTALCHAAGLSGEDLRSPETRVPLTSIYTLVEKAAAAIAEPLFGVRVASGVDVEIFDVLGFLVLTSPTFGVAMERTLRYQRLWNDGERYSLVVEAGRAHLRYEPFGAERRAHRLMAEMFAFDVGVNAPKLVAEPAFATAIRFRGEPSCDRAAYEAAFHAPVTFASPIDEVVLPANMFEKAMPLANEAMHAYFQRHADAALAQLGPEASLLSRLRTFVADRLPEGDASLAAAAASLGMSSRTLQRRLRAEGTSFEDLVDGVRRARAMAYLDARVSIAEVAYLLGYAEPSVFHRAFKRWTGMTPESWRAAEARGTSR